MLGEKRTCWIDNAEDADGLALEERNRIVPYDQLNLSFFQYIL